MKFKLLAIPAALGAIFAITVAVATANATLTTSCVGTTSGSNITWTATSTAGIAPVTFAWTDGTTTMSTSTEWTMVYAPGTYTITLTATDASSTVASASCMATVAEPAPTISSFTATPTTITVGQNATLTWTALNASSTALDNGIGAVSGTALVVSPATTTTYILSATNSGGTSTASVTITVNPAPAPTPAPTITSFGASSTTITTGQYTTLSWTTTNASSTSINNGVGTVTGNSIMVSPTTTTTYTLSATNPSGTATAAVTVNVSAPVVTATSTVAERMKLLIVGHNQFFGKAMLVTGVGSGSFTAEVFNLTFTINSNASVTIGSYVDVHGTVDGANTSVVNATIVKASLGSDVFTAKKWNHENDNDADDMPSSATTTPNLQTKEGVHGFFQNIGRKMGEGFKSAFTHGNGHKDDHDR